MKKSKPSSVHFVPISVGKFTLTDIEKEIIALNPESELYAEKHNIIVEVLKEAIRELNEKSDNSEELNLIKKESIEKLVDYGVTYQSIFTFLFGVLFSAFIGVYVNIGTGGEWDKSAIMTAWSTGIGFLIFGALMIFNIVKMQRLKSEI